MNNAIRFSLAELIPNDGEYLFHAVGKVEGSGSSYSGFGVPSIPTVSVAVGDVLNFSFEDKEGTEHKRSYTFDKIMRELGYQIRAGYSQSRNSPENEQKRADFQVLHDQVIRDRTPHLITTHNGQKRFWVKESRSLRS